MLLSSDSRDANNPETSAGRAPNSSRNSSFESIVLSEEQIESARRSRKRTRSSASSTPSPQVFSWEDAVDTGDYDPHHFYTGSSDDDGSISMTVRLPAGVYQQVQAIIQQRTIPNWGTMQELARDAIIHRLHFAMFEYRTTAALTRMLEVERARARTAQARHLRETQQAAVDEIRDELKALHDRGDEDGLRRFLDDNWRSAWAFGEPYRTEFRQVLETYGTMPEWVMEHDAQGTTPGDETWDQDLY